MFINFSFKILDFLKQFFHHILKFIKFLFFKLRIHNYTILTVFTAINIFQTKEKSYTHFKS